jgi:hypothetical protein
LKTHRISIHFNFTDPNTDCDLTGLDLTIPLWVTALHIHYQIEKRCILQPPQFKNPTPAPLHGPAITRDSPEHAFPYKFRQVFTDLNVEHLLVAVEVIGPTTEGPWRDQHVRQALQVYVCIESVMNDIDWPIDAHQTTRIRHHAAVILHNATGILARRSDDPKDDGFMKENRLWTQRAVFKKRALRLLDKFYARKRVMQAIMNGPRVQESTGWYGEGSNVEWTDEDQNREDLMHRYNRRGYRMPH